MEFNVIYSVITFLEFEVFLWYKVKSEIHTLDT